MQSHLSNTFSLRKLLRKKKLWLLLLWTRKLNKKILYFIINLDNLATKYAGINWKASFTAIFCLEKWNPLTKDKPRQATIILLESQEHNQEDDELLDRRRG